MYQSNPAYQSTQQRNHAPNQGYANHPNQPINPGASRNNPPQQQTEDKTLKDFFQIKVHGGKAAFNAYPSTTKKGWETISFEMAARSNPNNPSDRTYNWQDKVVLQITMTELPVLVAALHSFLPSVEFKNHGQNNDKGMAIIKQEKHFFCKMFAKNASVKAVPVSFPEMALVANLALSQYVKNFDGVSSDVALANLKTMARDLYKSSQAPLAQQ